MISTELVYQNFFFFFEKTWLFCNGKHFCQKNYDSTLAQFIKLETNTNKVKHHLEHLFEGYLKR